MWPILGLPLQPLSNAAVRRFFSRQRRRKRARIDNLLKLSEIFTRLFSVNIIFFCSRSFPTLKILGITITLTADVICSGLSWPWAKGGGFWFTCPAVFSPFCHFSFFTKNKGGGGGGLAGPSPRSAPGSFSWVNHVLLRLCWNKYFLIFVVLFVFYSLLWFISFSKILAILLHSILDEVLKSTILLYRC